MYMSKHCQFQICSHHRLYNYTIVSTLGHPCLVSLLFIPSLYSPFFNLKYLLLTVPLAMGLLIDMCPALGKGTIRRKNSKFESATHTAFNEENRTSVAASIRALTRAPFRVRYLEILRAEILWCNTRGGNAHNYEETLQALRAVDRLRSYAKR